MHEKIFRRTVGKSNKDKLKKVREKERGGGERGGASGVKTTSHRKFNKEILQVKIFLFIILSKLMLKKSKPFFPFFLIKILEKNSK